MTLPSQFSLEEENFYKDIQDLLKNSSQNEKELSLFLQRYMDLLARADLDDESFIINFTKAGLILEASAKVYGTKVDRLWNNLEHVLMSLRSRGDVHTKGKPLGDEEMDLEGDVSRRRLSMNSRRRKKVGDALVSADDFIEIDNITGLLVKNMNEKVTKSQGNLKFCEKVPNMFIKNKLRKRKIDVCLNSNVEEKDIIRLRDWVVTTECLLVKEIYSSIPEDNSTNDKNDTVEYRRQAFDSLATDKSRIVREEIEGTEITPVDKSRVEIHQEEGRNVVEREISIKEPTVTENLPPDKEMSFSRDFIEGDLNISKESDLAKFPNVLDRGPKACLVDVDEVFWDPQKFRDLIPSKKLKPGRSINSPCRLCKKKQTHQGRKKCVNRKRKSTSLDLYFIPHVQPTVGEPHFGILPDEELISAFKQEMKIIEQLSKVNAARNINEAFHPNENTEELKNFLGFDGFEKRFLRLSESNEDEIEFEDNNQNEEHNVADDPPPEEDFELPIPVIEESVRYRIISSNDDPGPKDDDRLAESEYQKLVKEGLKDHYEAKSIFAKNKELGIKISKWHEMISDKIKLSEKRGAMNMKSLASKILSSFPSPVMGELPQMSFRELVKNQCRRDIPRYFFGCLQLTNEGNLSISRTDPRPLATDCMMITRLRTTRKDCDLDESTVKSPTKEVKTPEVNRKLDSKTRSPVTIENKSSVKTKRVTQRMEKGYKRQKNFTAVNNSKKISESPITMETVQPEEQIECEPEFQLDVAPDEDEIKQWETPKKPKKVSTSPSDFFQEIDLSMGLVGESINETVGKSPKVKFHDNVFKMFVKPKMKKRTFAEDKKIIRLRDWFVTSECLLLNEIQMRLHRHKLSTGGRKRKRDIALIAEKMKLSRMIWLQRRGSTHGEKRYFKAIFKKSPRKAEIRIPVDHRYWKNLPSKRVIPRSNPVVVDLTQNDDEPGPSNVTLKNQTFTGVNLPKIRKF